MELLSVKVEEPVLVGPFSSEGSKDSRDTSRISHIVAAIKVFL